MQINSLLRAKHLQDLVIAVECSLAHQEERLHTRTTWLPKGSGIDGLTVKEKASV